jgi:DNA-binding IclR family transcriptional regulator
MQDTERHGIQAIARAARVLRALEAVPAGMTLGDLSAAVELPKSTVHRIVGALAAEELVTAPARGPVRLGSALARLATASRHALREELAPVLLALRQELEETVDLAVLEGATVRFVDQLAAPHRLRAESAVGAVFPAHATANGKALLAALPDEQVAALLPERLERFTSNTITSRDELLAELATIRREGVAYDREEHTEGISAVGAAIVDDGGPVAAISVPAPSVRFARERERNARALRRAVDEFQRTRRSDVR